MRVYNSDMNNSSSTTIGYAFFSDVILNLTAIIMQLYAYGYWNCYWISTIIPNFFLGSRKVALFLSHCLLCKIKIIYWQNSEIFKKFLCQRFTCSSHHSIYIDYIFVIYCITFVVLYELLTKITLHCLGIANEAPQQWRVIILWRGENDPWRVGDELFVLSKG